MYLEDKKTICYQLIIKCGIAIERREIYNNAIEVGDRLEEIEKQVGRKHIKEYIEKNIKILKINEMDVIN